MTKIRKQRRKKRFRVNVNRKRLRNKLQKLPTIECKEIGDSWEAKRSTRTNLRDMGLAYEPNEALKIPSTKRLYLKALKKKKILSGIENGDNENEDDDDDDDDESGKTSGRKQKNNVPDKIHVAETLEAEAKAPRERLFRLPKSQVHFVTYLMDKYGDDYKAMERDRKNYYQLTWCQIRAKINKFKSIPEQYAEYLVKSGEIVLDDPTPLEETRKRIGEENAKKYSAPKVPKVVKKRKSSLWEVEDADEVEASFHNEDKNLTDDSKDDAVKDTSGKGLKKLKLFSDDEESDADENDAEIKKRKDRIAGKETGKDFKSSEGKIRGQKNEIIKGEVGKKTRKSVAAIRKQESSDSDSDDEDDELENDDDDAEGFVNLSDVSEEELSEDDVLDDGEFVTDSNDENSD